MHLLNLNHTAIGSYKCFIECSTILLLLCRSSALALFSGLCGIDEDDISAPPEGNTPRRNVPSCRPMRMI